MFQDLKLQAEYIKENFNNVQIVDPIVGDNLIIYTSPSQLIDFLKFLRDDQNLSFKTLLDVFGADMLGLRNPRFEVVYNLLSYKLNNRITVKVAIEDRDEVPSAVSVFSSAGWFEREAFDMYGIKFSNHPDLRRILTDYDFEGYPLRKDFPLTGYKEVRYDENLKKVVYEDVKLMQEFRNFDFEMPWEGVKKVVQKNDIK
ncbi:MAG: NADH-quinone oxidoreductase subunit C [Proteobacteria bacterium]|nr:NADH-quinone oxidoreductase subunit C [Pseudomonadota bacterium]NCA27907.1 NADH-quinone oxidoreductase subunit C [Pseudomonadota bacterium]